ncbi:MAG TPA: class I SAM-dependent methyltransferase [Solirubrobacterales bacterium]
MADTSMQEFWDARADEDAFYFVDNRLDYGSPDLERFWAGGREALAMIERSLGVEVGEGETVVDIGCGIGRITRALAERGAGVRAIDVSARMLERARDLNPGLEGVEWLHGDGESLAPIETESADACVSLVVFHHIPDPRITLGYVGEIGRVLRPGGWAALGVSDQPELHRRPSPARRALARLRAVLGRSPGGQDHPAWLGSSVDLEEVSAAARGAGMVVERVTGEGTVHCLVLLRKREPGAMWGAEAVERAFAGLPEEERASIDPADRRIVERAFPNSLTGVPRLLALVAAVRRLAGEGVPGAFAECGVWRGGSIVAMIATLQEIGAADREIYLYDTFEGMTEPSERDGAVRELWERTGGRPWPEYFDPDVFTEEEVRATVEATGYPPEKLHFVRGRVEETLPAEAPAELALLRLDTDFYESTRHELEHLYPRLAPGGVLIIDDYGEFAGARQAVDEYFAGDPAAPELQPIDDSARLAVKVEPTA